MGLLFYIEPDLPDSIHTLTLSYTLYDITGAVEIESQVQSGQDRDNTFEGALLATLTASGDVASKLLLASLAPSAVTSEQASHLFTISP
jgi:hypothetical protein